ncbi:MAG: hypothetical protein A2887_05410 [Alphaproteobacteria bacterium RIFCSPLOWO2_01_FULL_40_26]|nr:MAG: hypothetical protein A3D15_05865 [Alphaproteobacteria bacterium RIFCSPHIGHO2_02_FULL_40_34]OFW85730.1 MAG: hypothetical protein A2794_00690 [Alphaproteobacteria bacterium RIFCSPHIGHO2_01_FULL_40_8]OFW94169.1 MAG: hypothetical protein A2887_05410 [Alphaproteobacteria bacterium RIFCSPLOWO2_01_FULL_40_26]OFX09738.1 MAG: hypothetical protein A3H30_00170 [Alphaproteobacteria bacterium RIFCSPLOWO2_02_FULL_40_19]OFX11446.1 MAG: hypothetical protein A3G22_02035 [Alphaproteobacteria bacterium RI
MSKNKNNKSYTELDVWRVAVEICDMIYSCTKNFPKEELFCLSNQIRRSAISIPSNIAEGCGRKNSKEIIQFLFIARGSIYELETQCLIANNQNFLAETSFKQISEKITRCKQLINGFINHHATTHKARSATKHEARSTKHKNGS